MGYTDEEIIEGSNIFIKRLGKISLFVLFILLFILLVSIVQAEIIIQNSNRTIDSSQTISSMQGLDFKVDINDSNVIFQNTALSTATKCHLGTNATPTVWLEENVSIVDSNCTFTKRLSNLTGYKVFLNAGGNSYTSRYGYAAGQYLRVKADWFEFGCGRDLTTTYCDVVRINTAWINYSSAAPPAPSPTLTLDSDLLNNSITTEQNLTIHYNGTFTDEDTTLMNCSLLVNNTVNMTDNNINLSENQDFTFTSARGLNFYKFDISCSNYEVSDTDGSFYYSFNVEQESDSVYCQLAYNDTQAIRGEINMNWIVILWIASYWLTLELFRRGYGVIGVLTGFAGLGIDFILTSLMRDTVTLGSDLTGVFMVIGTLIFYFTLPIMRVGFVAWGGVKSN